MAKPPPRRSRPSGSSNPYHQDHVTPSKDNTTRNILIVLGGTALVGLLACGGAAFYFAKGVTQAVTSIGEGLEEYAASIAPPPDNPEVREKYAAEFQQFYAKLPEDSGFEGISRSEAERLAVAIESISDAMTREDDAAFSALVDKDLFWDAVKSSGQLSIQAKRDFAEFKISRADGTGFSDLACPDDGQLILKGATKQDGTLMAYTFETSPGNYPQPMVWFFKDDGESLRLFDWMESYDMRRFSEHSAREFSSSMGDSRKYENYLAYDISKIAEMSKLKANIEIRALMARSYPEQLLTKVLYELRAAAYVTENYELVEELSQRMVAAGDTSPRVEWSRIRVLDNQGKDQQAVEKLAAFEKTFGTSPRIEQLRAVILSDTGDKRESSEAAIRRFAMLPEFMDTELFGELDEEQATRVVRIIQKHKDPVPIAIALASEIPGTKLAEKVLGEVDTSADTSANAYATRAAVAHESGNIDLANEQYRRAIKASDSPSDREEMVDRWSRMMVSNDRGVEAIQTSADPAATYESISQYAASDEKRKQYADALADVAVPSDPIAAKRLKATQLYAKASLSMEAEQHERTWDTLVKSWQLFTELDPSPPEGESATLIPGRVKSAVAITAVKASKIEEGHRLLESYESGLASATMLTECLLLTDSTALKDFLVAQQKRAPAAAIVKCVSGILKLREGDREAGRDDLINYVKAVRERETAPQMYRVKRLLVEDAVEHNEWRRLIGRIGAKHVQENLIRILRNQNRRDELAAALDLMAKERDFSRATLFDAREEHLRQTWQWNKLIALAKGCPEGTEPYALYQFEALLALERYDEAEKVLEDLTEDEERLEATAQLAACRGERAKVEQMLKDDEWLAGSLGSPWVRERVAEWDGFDSAQPQGLGLPTYHESIFLLKDVATPTPESIHSDFAGIEDIKPQRLGQTTDIDLWQIVVKDHRFLMIFGKTPYFSEAPDTSRLPEGDAKRIIDHKGWFAIIDDIRRNEPVGTTERLIGRIAAAFLTGSTKPNCVACGYGQSVSVFKPAYIDKLKAGQLDDFSFKSVSLSRESKRGYLTADERRLKQTELKRVLKSNNPEVTIVWKPADSEIRLKCKLLRLSENGYNATVQLGQDAPYPTWVRGKKWVVRTRDLDVPNAD